MGANVMRWIRWARCSRRTTSTLAKLNRLAVKRAFDATSTKYSGLSFSGLDGVKGRDRPIDERARQRRFTFTSGTETDFDLAGYPPSTAQLVSWRVGCEAAVGRDVGEDLLDQGQDVGIFDGVDVVAAFSACADQASQAEFAQVLAHCGHADAGAFCQGGDVVDVLGGKP